MSKLPPRERAAINQRIKQLTAQIQDRSLPLERVEHLQRERAILHAQLMADRAAAR